MPVSGFLASRYEIVQRIVNAPEAPTGSSPRRRSTRCARSVQALASNLWLGIPLLVVAGRPGHVVAGRAGPAPGRAHAPRGRGDLRTRTLHRRVDEPATGDEVARLAHTMNAMLDRLEAAQTDAAPVRVATPPTSCAARWPTIRTERRGGASCTPDGADWPDVATTVLHESERLDELVGDLLALAKLDETGGGDAPRCAGSSTSTRSCWPTWPGCAVLGHAVRADGVSAARVEGDAVQLQRLVRNLLDNAARHATSAGDGDAAARTAGEAVLRVDDDGPGIPAARPRAGVRALRPARRGPDARRRAAPGLGLSLVKAVAVSHGGTVARARRTGRRGPLRGPPPAGRGRRARHSVPSSISNGSRIVAPAATTP